jgi:hypothetical protein
MCCLVGGAFLGVPLMAQVIDGNIIPESSKPATIADETRDPAERVAYLILFMKNTAEKTLALAKDFLQRYPQSAFLFMVYKIAALISFDLGDLKVAWTTPISLLPYCQRILSF